MNLTCSQDFPPKANFLRSTRCTARKPTATTAKFCDQNSFILCIYVTVIQLSLTLVLPSPISSLSLPLALRFLLERSSSCGFPVKGEDLRRDQSNRSEKLFEITVITKSASRDFSPSRFISFIFSVLSSSCFLSSLSDHLFRDAGDR